ncbi:disease resistance protein, partial [Striga asiatica]
MVGLDDVLLEAMDKLMGQHSARQILPIVGMGGIGKTILARNLYSNPTVVEHFYLRGWATISQQYDSKEILLQVLVCLKVIESMEMLSKKKEYEIGEILYKTLCGQKYLIVMDDVWSVRAWDKVKFFFPDNNNGSRIVITTRLSDLAFELSGSRGLEMGFLNEDNSWNLFWKSVFGEKDCPPELEEIGKKISKNCKGLPLSIVVTGGLLAMSVQTLTHWQYIAENLNSVVNLNDNERCLRILSLSYNHLPVHLKPCFIYMGIFPEDQLVKASTLVNLWIAEGFLKPIGDKTLEAAAEEYLKDLVQRNLILVQELGHHGDIKRFGIHDLLRDLCMKEAEKDRFFCVAATDRPNTEQEGSSKHVPRAVGNAIRSATLARSLICSADKFAPARRRPWRLLKVFHRIEVVIPEYMYSLKDVFRPVNSRHIDLDLIKKDAEEIVKQLGCQLERNYSMPAGGPRPHPSGLNGSMVGLDDVLLEAMDKLMGQHSARQILPIVGMGGIGKTILARNLYSNPTVEEYFYLRGWATVSQQYESKEILLEVLVCLKVIGSREVLSKKKEYEIGEILYKTLCGQKYLIVMDDVWSVRAWDKVKFFFPDNNNGSRIVITTRLSDLAFELSGSRGLGMGFLNEDNSWNLFRKSVFGEKDCPPELEEIGKKISKNCKGLPLSIVVTGGLLAMSVQTRKHWQYIAENLNSVVNLNDNERCLRILRLSYNHLPVHLKPCFIYMGIFPEDQLVKASTLVNLWVAEGFLKPIGDKTLEAAAEEYLKDLVQRNLILVQEFGHHGDIKRFGIHDLLRDLCMKEAEKDRFFCVAATDRPNTEQIWHTQRRIGIQRREGSSEHVPRAVGNAVRSAMLARSLICSADKLRRHPCRLLKVFHRIEVFIAEYGYSLKDIFRP